MTSNGVSFAALAALITVSTEARVFSSSLRAGMSTEIKHTSSSARNSTVNIRSVIEDEAPVKHGLGAPPDAGFREVQRGRLRQAWLLQARRFTFLVRAHANIYFGFSTGSLSNRDSLVFMDPADPGPAAKRPA